MVLVALLSAWHQPVPVSSPVKRFVLDNYARHTRPDESLKGLRIGIVRESMTVRPGTVRSMAARPKASSAAWPSSPPAAW